MLFTYDCGEEGDARLAAAEARIAAGEEVEIYPLKVLFDTLETSEVRLSRKPKMDLSHLMPQSEEAEERATEAPAEEITAGYLDMSEDAKPV